MSNKRTTLTAVECFDDHGGKGNAALVYGHFGNTRVCFRAGNRWFFAPRIVSVDEGAVKS